MGLYDRMTGRSATLTVDPAVDVRTNGGLLVWAQGDALRVLDLSAIR
jgi:hypothetical protein